LPLAVAIGLCVRLVPSLRHPTLPLVADAAYHLRLVEETLAAGELPAIDRLSTAPEGRRTVRELPVGLYVVAASAHRGLATLGFRDLKWNLAFFIALCGGLIAVPVWVGTRAVFENRAAASLAGLCSVFLPAHLARSYGYWLRYDALGTLLASTHVALAMATLRSPRPWRRRGLAVASAVLLVAAIWVWRVSFLVLAIELAYVVFRLVSRGACPALRELWVAVAVIGTAGLAPIEYLSQRGFLLSAPWILTIALAAAMCLPQLREGGRPGFRLTALVIVAGLAWGLGRTHIPADYAGLGALIPTKLGLARGHDPLATLMLEVEELAGGSPWTLAIGSQRLFVLGVWLLASPILFWWLAGRPGPTHWMAIGPAAALLATVIAGLAASTMLFERTSVLLAPFAAVALGGLGARLVDVPGATDRPAPVPTLRRKAPAPRNRGGRRLRRRLAVGLAVSGIATALAGLAQAFSSGSLMPPEQAMAIEFLRNHTPPQAIVLGFWDAGYDIQTYARRATVMDGLLESNENRGRIFAFDSAVMKPTPEALEALCRRRRAGWLLVPPLPYIYTAAAVAGDPIAARIASDLPLREGVDTERVLYHLMTADVPVPGFRLVYRAGDYRVYEFLGLGAGS